MQGLKQIELIKKGADFFKAVTSAWLNSIAEFPNASWTVSLPPGGGSASFKGSTKSVVLDLTHAKIAGYEQPGQMCIQGVLYDVTFLLKDAGTEAT